MRNSSKNRTIVLGLSLLILSGCATSYYHANDPTPFGTDIRVTPDRIVVECEYISGYDGDYSDPYGFMIHVLDESKTVLTISNGTVVENKDCFVRLKAAEEIIAKGNVIVVRGRGDATGPVKMERHLKLFPRHGRFPSNGRSLNYLAIWNDKGQCYDAFYGSEKPCPRTKD